jgi:hypothetical protein
MPLGQSQDIPQTDPRGMATPRFWHRLPRNSDAATGSGGGGVPCFITPGGPSRPWQLIRFRHVNNGSFALASLNHICRSFVPTFPQRSPPSLLTTAACGGLRSTPDCRPRRALLHLSYSYTPPCGPAILVTQDPKRTLAEVTVAGCESIFRTV